MSPLLSPDPRERIALSIADRLTVAKLQLDVVRRAGPSADHAARFAAIGHHIDAVALDVGQLVADGQSCEPLLP